MALAILLAGIILLVAGIRGKHDDLIGALKDDFTGPNNFFIWVIAIGVLVGLTNVDKIKPVANAFLGLVILVMLISNRGFFTKFPQEIKKGTT